MYKNIQLLIRTCLSEDDEIASAARYFNVVKFRADITQNALVIPRYSSLPYYEELEYDINKIGGQLINTYKMHKYIADFEYYEDIKDYTFESWKLSEAINIPNIPLVVKGATNSKKWNWNTHMFAECKTKAMQVAANLSQDGLISGQEIIFRRYEPLLTFEIGINGLRFTNEYRFFFAYKQLVAGGYYWSTIDDKLIPPIIPNEAISLAKYIANIIGNKTNFFVLDIAQKEDKSWVVVEVNCGTMSGLSLIDIDTFYFNLKEILDG